MLRKLYIPIWLKLFLASILFVLIFIMSILFLKQLDEWIPKQLEDYLFDAGRMLRSYIHQSLEDDPNPTLREPEFLEHLDRFVEGYKYTLTSPFRVQILDHLGMVVYDSNGKGLEDVSLKNHTEVKKALLAKSEKENFAGSRISQNFGYDEKGNPITINDEAFNFYHCALPVILDSDDLFGVVYISSSTRRAMLVLWQVRDEFTYLGIGTMVLMVILVIFFYRSIIKPIRSLTLSARNIQKGNWDLDPSIHTIRSKDEIEEMKNSFLKMVKEVKGKIDFLKGIASTISHEFKTPLTAIQGAAEMLADGAYKEKKTREKFLNNIFHESKRLNRMVDEILRYSKLEEDIFHLKLERIHYLEFIDQVLDYLQPVLNTKPIEIIRDYRLDQPYLWIEPDKLEQVFSNILSNAIRYIPDTDGKIWIRVFHHREEIVTQVVNNGKEISEKVLPKIFHRFFTTDKTQGGGTGLGLSIAQDIILAHRGTLTADNEFPLGARFTFTLPQNL